MASPPKRVYWDACAWIAVIQKEKIQKNGVIEDREMMGKTVIEAAKKNKLEILTSAFCLAEVCKNEDVRDQSPDKIAEYFENDYILVVALDKFVGERARQLMLGGYSKLKPPDASHVATALLMNVDEMHTFDDKLIDLSGLLDRADGKKLKICKPSTSDPTPLFGPDVFGANK
jgi:predicted nucleic acid-binding protein